MSGLGLGLVCTYTVTDTVLQLQISVWFNFRWAIISDERRQMAVRPQAQAEKRRCFSSRLLC